MPRSAFHVARTTSTKFATITKDPDTVYWLTDTKQLFLGSVEYIPADIATKQYVDEKVSGGGLDYKGTLGTGGDYTDLPTANVKGGEVYRVITAGTYAGKQCSVGDVILAIKDDAVPTNDTWAIITDVDVQSIIQQAQAHWAPIVEPQS